MPDEETPFCPARIVIADMTTRPGLREAWDALDAETQQQIAQTWDSLIRGALPMFSIGEVLVKLSERLHYRVDKHVIDNRITRGDLPDVTRRGKRGDRYYSEAEIDHIEAVLREAAEKKRRRAEAKAAKARAEEPPPETETHDA